MMLTLFVTSLFLISGCGTNPRLPDNTYAAFVVKKDKDNRAKMAVIDRNGNVLNLKDAIDKATKMKATVATKVKKGSDGKKTQEIRITLKDGSCIAQVCLPEIPCFPVVIDPINNCPSF